MAPRKQKRQEEIAQRLPQAATSPVAEAVAIGTAAGGLVLGTMQAQGAIPDSQHDTPILRPDDAPTSNHTPVATAPTPDVPVEVIAPVDVAALAPQLATDQIDPTVIDTPAHNAPALDHIADLAAVTSATPVPIQTQLVSELSEQMTATLVKVIGNAEPGLSPTDLGQSIASDIVASAQDIVAKLDIGALLAQTQNLGDSIIAKVNAPSIIAEALGATSSMADSLLAEGADLPSSLLGNEGADGSGGLLSELFYADGASDSLDIPLLSDVAATVVGAVGDGGSGLLGLSYIDNSDHQGGHGLNALSLL